MLISMGVVTRFCDMLASCNYSIPRTYTVSLPTYTVSICTTLVLPTHSPAHCLYLLLEHLFYQVRVTNVQWNLSMDQLTGHQINLDKEKPNTVIYCFKIN